jgi:ribosome-binding protein aMBF1 (putative translation factor)
MGTPQIITTEAGDLVVLPRADYDALLARAGDGDAEDIMTARIIARTDREEAFPESVWAAIENGAHPVEVFRKHRGMTQAQLSASSKVSQGFISELEKSGKTPSLSTLQKLGQALGVTGTMLVPEQGVTFSADPIDD